MYETLARKKFHLLTNIVLMPLLFVLFLFIPLIEIYFLIKVGSLWGAGITIFLVVLTAVIGAYLVRSQGISTWARVQQKMHSAEMPAVEMFEGLFILVAGALLLTPGFFTDGIGFACLVPPLRRWLIQRAMAKGIQGVGAAGFSYRRGDIQDAEYTTVEETEIIDLEPRDPRDRS